MQSQTGWWDQVQKEAADRTRRIFDHKPLQPRRKSNREGEIAGKGIGGEDTHVVVKGVLTRWATALWFVSNKISRAESSRAKAKRLLTN